MDQQNDILERILVKVVEIDAKVNGIEEKMMTKDDAREMESRMLGHIDGFIKLHETLDVELVSLQSKYNRLEERLVRVEQRVGIVA